MLCDGELRAVPSPRNKRVTCAPQQLLPAMSPAPALGEGMGRLPTLTVPLCDWRYTYAEGALDGLHHIFRNLVDADAPHRPQRQRPDERVVIRHILQEARASP
jgi:hypothetical protein